MTKKELKYMEEYMLKETGTIPYNEYKYDEEEQTAFELIISDAIDSFRKQNASKKAITETGLEVQVPLFINEGDIIKIDTRDGKYIERVNK